MDSAEVFSLYKPDWAVLTQSMARMPLRASEFLQSMVDAESMECFLAAPDYAGWDYGSAGARGQAKPGCVRFDASPHEVATHTKGSGVRRRRKATRRTWRLPIL